MQAGGSSASKSAGMPAPADDPFARLGAGLQRGSERPDRESQGVALCARDAAQRGLELRARDGIGVRRTVGQQGHQRAAHCDGAGTPFDAIHRRGDPALHQVEVQPQPVATRAVVSDTAMRCPREIAEAPGVLEVVEERVGVHGRMVAAADLDLCSRRP